MKRSLITLAAALCCAYGGQALAMTHAEYKTQEDKVEADYKMAKEKCSGLNGNAKDVCKTEAKGAEKVAKAELKAQYKPNGKSEMKAREAKADADYKVAKEKCEDLKAGAMMSCKKDAKATHKTAIENARVVTTSQATAHQ